MNRAEYEAMMDRKIEILQGIADEDHNDEPAAMTDQIDRLRRGTEEIRKFREEYVKTFGRG